MASKSRAKKEEALRFYSRQVKKLYPNAIIEVEQDTLDDRTPWISVRVPARSVVAAARKFAGLELEVDDRYGVFFVTITGALNGKAAA